MKNLSTLMSSVLSIAREAGNAILRVYQNESSFKLKEDLSPVTEADLRAHKIISHELLYLTPEFPVLSEEDSEVSYSEREIWDRYWLVDPLDGTKEFIEKKDEFTVNIAFIDNHQPVLGVVYAPALKIAYYACVGEGAFKQIENESPQPIQTTKVSDKNIRVIASRRHGLEHLENFLKQFEQVTQLACGSALKFCLIAEGAADVYPRFGATSEWDTAAGQCIVEQAGGVVLSLKGTPLRYNTKESLENPWFLAAGDAAFANTLHA
jgi:3'(2'), 5'-bisphosphate nucleotidase